MASTSATSSASDGVLTRAQNFIQENKKVIVAGVAAVAVVGAVAYVYSSSSPSPRGSKPKDLEHGDASSSEKKKKKSKHSSKSKKSGLPNENGEGPLLEEIVPEIASRLATDDITQMSEQERNSLAADLKKQGNEYYASRNFTKAAELYTRAIEIAAKPEAMYYSNRSACYINLSPPLYEKVVEDCDAALKLSPTYIKALNRRAQALEGLEKYEDSLRDYVATSFLENMQVQQTTDAIDRVLRKIAEPKAAEIIATREPKLPGDSMVAAYFASYRPRPLPVLPEDPTIADKQLLLAYEALLAKDYKHALSLVNESLMEPLEPGQGISWDKGRAEALTLRGSFKYLMQDPTGAKEDFAAALEANPSSSHTWLKIANIHLDAGEIPESFECFEKAIAQDEKDADVYYHRGQTYFVMNQFDKAAEDYAHSTELDRTFVFSHIQLAVAHYKMGDIQRSMADFRKILKNFPHQSEPHNYYGEILLDQGRFQDAIEKFERAMEIERSDSKRVNVLPLVNKALAIFQWKKDTETAVNLCNEALAIDPGCDAAIATLGQMYFSDQNFEKALETFKKLLDIVTNPNQLILALYQVYSIEANAKFVKNYPQHALRSLGQ